MKLFSLSGTSSGPHSRNVSWRGRGSGHSYVCWASRLTAPALPYVRLNVWKKIFNNDFRRLRIFIALKFPEKALVCDLKLRVICFSYFKLHKFVTLNQTVLRFITFSLILNISVLLSISWLSVLRFVCWLGTTVHELS